MARISVRPIDYTNVPRVIYVVGSSRKAMATCLAGALQEEFGTTMGVRNNVKHGVPVFEVYGVDVQGWLYDRMRQFAAGWVKCYCKYAQ